MKYLSSLKNKNLPNKICLLRVDLNLASAELHRTNAELRRKKFRVSQREVSVNLRLTGVLPTIKFLIGRGAKVVILSHRGRPTKVQSSKFKVQSYTLKPFTATLSKLLKKPVKFIDLKKDFKAVKTIIKKAPKSSVFLLENLRFSPGEDKNDKKFAKKLASLGDFYVNDAFSVNHRKNASVVAMTKFLPAYAGLLLEKEIKNLSMAVKNPKHPLVVILGGAKISDKIGVIKNFLKRADYFLIGGGVANTFFAAQGLPIYNSLYEKEMVLTARQLLKLKKIILPIDSAISVKGRKKEILDIGPRTIEKYNQIIKKAKTIIWNGPMGYFENPKFAKGSKAVTQAILKSHAFAIIGGGETTSLFGSAQRYAENYVELRRKKFRVGPREVSVSPRMFISTGGGAMLQYLAGKKLPGIAALDNSRASLATGGKP